MEEELNMRSLVDSFAYLVVNLFFYRKVFLLLIIQFCIKSVMVHITHF